jgi:hypothetical protein
MAFDQHRADRIMGSRYNQGRTCPCGVDQSLPIFLNACAISSPSLPAEGRERGLKISPNEIGDKFVGRKRSFTRQEQRIAFPSQFPCAGSPKAGPSGRSLHRYRKTLVGASRMTELEAHFIAPNIASRWEVADAA